MTLTCSSTEIQSAMEAFFRFMDLPEEIKLKYSMRLDPNDRGTEIGYWTRRRAEGHPDDRGYFHYSEAAERHFRTNGADCPELLAFMDAAKAIYSKVLPTLREAIYTVDEHHPGIEQRISNPGADLDVRAPLRFLGYAQTTVGDFLATGHFDRGVATLAIAESAPGLRIGKTPETVKEVMHEPGYGLFFPGISLQEFTNESFAPSWHDVVQKNEGAYKPGYARWALVLFAGVWEKRVKTWEECHTPQYV
jgi:isopenicillin N synthase-like dioxygenase